ncbi:LytR/AlgR family response regulator transcription factor [Flavilitoribacter nigricans]|uniref:HTH LytTR-type domain-containing protein n=1 Tax=Flavilitoribacter nigricans (strain ATCC 23147 / DSM 23189 / NBRC 102662 / NCIMB 1420 / SS-2) TaxID=1122177 RepID=A0A2D0NBG0_FLAN2|nr:LytTR family DNA-binding domain-containing protein [Flavilitoribacter nigricans]PHN05718.1 hypothetical protein CRP01_14675 [Flavilitoribacter nigricans DSM 23189 = NBRC 102662]
MKISKLSVWWVIGLGILLASCGNLALDLLWTDLQTSQKIGINLLAFSFFGYQLLTVLWIDRKVKHGLHSMPQPGEFAYQPPAYRQRFLVKQGQKLLSVETSEIAWIHAEGKLCYCKTWDNHRYFLEYSLEELIEMLDPVLFFRVNRSYIVHYKSLKAVSPYFNRKLILQLHPAPEQSDVIISKEKSTEFKRWLGK